MDEPRGGDGMPGERRPATKPLDRPPSERYGRPTDRESAPVRRSGSLARAFGFALPAAVIALFAYVGLAGPFAFSSGLVIVAIFAGRLIGLAAKAGGGGAISSDRSVVVALVVTLGWIVLAQVATWIYARNEGGVLPIVDYLLQVFGPIVPLVAIASVLAAWWSAR